MVDAADLERIAERIGAQVKSGAEPERKPVARPAPKQETEHVQRSAETEEREESGTGQESPDPPDSEVANPDVERARKAGWRPKEEWDGNPDEWVSHKTFLKNGELYDSIRTLKRKDAERDEAIKALTEHNKRMAEALAKARKAEIDAQRDQAIEMGDKDRVRALDREANDFDKSLELPKVAQAPAIDPAYTAWAEENTWFKSDPEMRDFAIAFHDLQAAKGLGPEALGDVTKAVHRAFPDRFEQKPEIRERRLSAVESPASKPIARKTRGYSDLPEHAKEVAKKFERLGTMKRDEYAKQFFEME